MSIEANKYTLSQLLTLYDDNTTAEISERDLRDGFKSVIGSMSTSGISADKTLNIDDIFLKVDTSSNNINITLPLPNADDGNGSTFENKYYTLYNSGINNVIVSGDFLNNVTSATISQNESISIISSDTNWVIYQKTSFEAFSDINTIKTTSANWDSAYSTVNANSAVWSTSASGGTVDSVNNILPDVNKNVSISATNIPTSAGSDVQAELDSLRETLSLLERATGSFTYDALTLSTTETTVPLTLVTQSSNTDIFYINDTNDTLDIISVSSYLNLATLDFVKTTGTSVSATYRIYNENDVQLGSDYAFLLDGNGSFQRTVHITENDRPIGQYYATLQLSNNAATTLQSTSLASIVAFNATASSTDIYPPVITLSNIDTVANTYGLLYKIASTTVSKPSYRDSQTSQFDNSDCDPSVSLGGYIRNITIHSAAMAVSTATASSAVYSRIGVYSILTLANGGPVLLGEYDIPVTPNSNIGIYNNTGSPNGVKGTIAVNLSVPANTLLGFQLIYSSSFSGDNEYINTWRNTFVGISIY